MPENHVQPEDFRAAEEMLMLADQQLNIAKHNLKVTMNAYQRLLQQFFEENTTDKLYAMLRHRAVPARAAMAIAMEIMLRELETDQPPPRDPDPNTH